MKIAIFQMNSSLTDTKINLSKIDVAAREASSQGAQLLICPELAITGYGAEEGLHANALTADKEGMSDLCKISKECNIALITGYSEKTKTGHANSAVFIEDGEIKANYHKCQLWGDYEASYFEAGDPSAVIAELAGPRIGMLICYDVEFPERVRALAKAGVDLIAVPTATPTGAAATFIAEKMISVRSFENQVFIAYVNHHGFDGKFSYAGLSCVAAPNGELLAQAESEDDALLFAEIEPAEYEEFCKETPYLKDLIEG
jgi:predicted amidohydrolase